jgi:hypothetical protein
VESGLSVATLDDVDDTLYAALDDLQRDDDHPARLFALVARFTGQVQMTPGGITLQAAAMGRLPAVLWQWVGEDPRTDFEDLDGERIDSGVVQWVAWVLMQDTRGPARQVKGTTSAPGVHALNDAVITALNGVASTDFIRAHRVRYARSRAFLAERGVHVTQVTFEARRQIPFVPVAEPTQDLLALRADANNVDEALDADNPLNTFDANTEA